MTALEREFDFQDGDFRFLAKLVGEKTGIVLADHKKDMVYGRVARRVRALGLKTVKQYCDFLSRSDGETEIFDFVNAVTTNLTRFFREAHHFEHLGEEVFSDMLENPPPGKRVRIWSAGCSSGMEAYSIAMTAFDSIPDIKNWDFKILATDIDTSMLRRGSEGIYQKKDMEGIPPEYRKRFILKYGGSESGQYAVSEDVKKLITFKRLNFLDKWPVKGPFDVIFCRNVVIYFDKETQKEIFGKFAGLLKQDGWLYVGHSENISRITSEFCLKGRTVYQKIK